MSFQNQIDDFFDKYDINGEIHKIDVFCDMRNVQNDIVRYAPSFSIPMGECLGSSHDNKDKMLNLVQRFDRDCKIHNNVLDTLENMNEEYTHVLIQYYIEHISVEKLRKQNSNPYILEDALVCFAANDTEYGYADTVKAAYEKLKNEYLSWLENVHDFQFDMFNNDLEKYPSIFDIQGFRGQDPETGGYRRKKKCFTLGLLYLNNILEYSDFKRLACCQIGGMKMLRKINSTNWGDDYGK